MVAVYQSQQLNSNNLNWYVTLGDGTPVAVDSITYQVEDIRDRYNPVEVLPVSPATEFGTGAYYAQFTVPADWDPGQYKINWSWIYQGLAAQTGSEEFEVRDATSGSTTRDK